MQVVKQTLPAIKNAETFDPDNIYIWASITQRACASQLIACSASLAAVLDVQRNSAAFLSRRSDS